ncbi:MAG: DUF4360 domain-containing protein [Bacteriovoracia bacterium]
MKNLTKLSGLTLSILLLACGAAENASALGPSRPSPPPPPAPPPSSEIALAASGGTGCPADTALALVTTSERGEKVLTVSTSQYTATLSSRTEAKLERKSCALTVSASEVPANHRVVIAKTLLLGAVELAAGASAQAAVEAFLPGGTGPKLSTSLGSLDDEVSDALVLELSEPVATLCGETSGILRVNTSLVLKREERLLRDSTARIDSIALILKTEPCSL